LLADAARAQGVQIIWNLCHYGWPDDIDLLSSHFVDRFARYCGTVARFIADQSDEVPFYAPVNEISFFCWAASRDLMYPFAHGRDNEIKHQLVRAAIAGCEAIWSVDRRARILHGDPVIHIVPPPGKPELAAAAAAHRASQFEAWDMLAGVQFPELGGHPRYLDIVGLNFYHSNQWEFPDVRLRWEDEPRDSRWVPLHLLIAELYDRYRRPVMIAETSHFGSGRARWIREIAQEVHATRAIGVPLQGVCLFPILDRPDWEDFNHWHNSGLWDLIADGNGNLKRVINAEYESAFKWSRELVAGIKCT
jgi:beta-glucosidase/6-phospho-beta-glucosidase/beta-galactosidase